MNKAFQVGDWVVARDYFYGQVADIEDSEALIEFETEYGGGSMWFHFSELEHTKPREVYPGITHVRNFSVGGNLIDRTCSLSLWNEDEDGNERDSTSIDLTQGQLKSLIKSLQLFVEET